MKNERRKKKFDKLDVRIEGLRLNIWWPLFLFWEILVFDSVLIWKILNCKFFNALLRFLQKLLIYDFIWTPGAYSTIFLKGGLLKFFILMKNFQVGFGISPKYLEKWRNLPKMESFDHLFPFIFWWTLIINLLIISRNPKIILKNLKKFWLVLYELFFEIFGNNWD